MTARKAVPLNSQEILAVDGVRTSSALTELAGEGAGKSEATTLHALVLLGLERVREVETVHGYAALAAAQDEEDHAYAAAMRGRRRGGQE